MPKHIILIKPNFWEVKHPEWLSLNGEERQKVQENTIKEILDALRSEGPASLIINTDFMSTVTITDEQAAQYEFMVLVDPNPLLNELHGFLSKNLCIGQHVSGPYDAQKAADDAVEKTRKDLLKRIESIILHTLSATRV